MKAVGTPLARHLFSAPQTPDGQNPNDSVYRSIGCGKEHLSSPGSGISDTEQPFSRGPRRASCRSGEGNVEPTVEPSILGMGAQPPSCGGDGSTRRSGAALQRRGFRHHPQNLRRPPFWAFENLFGNFRDSKKAIRSTPPGRVQSRHLVTGNGLEEVQCGEPGFYARGSGLPLRVAIHPFDLHHRLSDDLYRLLWGPIRSAGCEKAFHRLLRD